MKVLGITDSVSTCDCCGRSGLKRTVALESETKGTVYYGTGCAAMAVRGNKRPATVRAIVGEAEVSASRAKQLEEEKLYRITTEKGFANYRYQETNRKMEGSYFLRKGPEVVRVDGTDPVDVEFFRSRGFSKT